MSNKTTQDSYGNSQTDRVVSDIDTQFKEVGSQIELGCNYDLGEKHYIDFSIYLNPNKKNQSESKSGDYKELIIHDGNEIVVDTYDLTGGKDLDYGYIGSTLTYEYSLTKDRSNLLSLYVDYGSATGSTNEKIVNRKEYSDHTEEVGSIGYERGEFVIEGNVAYKRELSKDAKFEIGGNVDIEEIPAIGVTNGVFDQDGNLISFADEPKCQEVDYKQNIYAGYLIYSSKISKFEYKLGLRAELTDRRSNYSFQGEDSIFNF